MDPKRLAFESHIRDIATEERLIRGPLPYDLLERAPGGGDGYLNLYVSHRWAGWKARGEYEAGVVIKEQLTLRMGL